MALRKVAISGCRSVDLTRLVLDLCCGHPMQEYLVGDCPTGVDASVREWCSYNDYSVTVYVADWDKHGKAAGPIRNKEMVADADILHAFWDGESRGTLSAIREATKVGVTVHIHPVVIL